MPIFTDVQRAFDTTAVSIFDWWAGRPLQFRQLAGTALQLGVFSAGTGWFLKWRNAVNLKRNRKLAFAALLHRSQHVDDTIYEVNAAVKDVIDFQTDIVDRLLKWAGSIDALLDHTQKEFSEKYNQYMKENEDQLIGAKESLRRCLSSLEKEIHVIDDTIESHINTLDFTSAFFANHFRTSVRSFYHYVVQMNHRFEAITETVNSEFDLRIAESLQKNHSTAFGDTEEKSEKVRLYELMFDVAPDVLKQGFKKEFEKIRREILRSSKVLKSFVSGRNMPKLKGRGPITVHGPNTKFDKAGQYYVLSSSDTDYNMNLYLDGLEGAFEDDR